MAVLAVKARAQASETVNPTGTYVAAGQVGPDPPEFFRAFEVAQDPSGEPSWEIIGGRASRLVDLYFPLRTLGNAGVAMIAMEFGFHGPSNNHAQSDVSGIFALDEAIRDLQQGVCDAAVVGASDSLTTSASYVNYKTAGLLSAGPPEKAYRPFDESSDGLVLGEGAAVLVLERADDALARGAAILAHLCGVGTDCDISHDAFAGIGRNQPGFRYAEDLPGFDETLRRATDGNLPDFIIASGSGVAERDRWEASLLEQSFGKLVPVTALKSLTGYLGAATGLVESVFAICAASEKKVPPIARLEHPAANIGLNLVRNEPHLLDRSQASGLIVTHSWTGQTAALMVRSIA